ncbi:MAG TPA: 3-dehydroquinate synthase [Candidatus Acidoferrales bacterium]|nr:3-dehydroquinate synthase [Candidatus Acidoferrales bacterium]
MIVGHGALSRLRDTVEDLRCGGRVFLLSSPRVWGLWGREVQRRLGRVPGNCVILFDDREIAKTLATVQGICRKLAKSSADRQAVLVAIGGGVVGDVAGFVAASYMRGVRIVHVPTTLVAQVDSAIGGKTGVDLPEGKNLIGAFHQPRAVLADPALLTTLNARQFCSGLHEVIKYGVIGDAGLFHFLEREMKQIMAKDYRALEFVIERCARQKARIVKLDERESNLRQILNFGHTMGHALEALTGYERFLHGEAVGWGMLGATLIGAGLDRIGERSACRIASLIARCGPLPALPSIPPSTLFNAMARDKKSRHGHMRWVIPSRIGAADIGMEVPAVLVEMVWRELPRFYAKARRDVAA